uniref:Uncharacterized protein n=1 Tax=Rhodnius prolixus TaxID=13249 RepID=T1HG82_RHOPR
MCALTPSVLLSSIAIVFLSTDPLVKKILRVEIFLGHGFTVKLGPYNSHNKQQIIRMKLSALTHSVLLSSML